MKKTGNITEIETRGGELMCPDAMAAIYVTACENCNHKKGYGQTDVDARKEQRKTVKCDRCDELDGKEKTHYYMLYEAFIEEKEKARAEKEREAKERKLSGKQTENIIEEQQKGLHPMYRDQPD